MMICPRRFGQTKIQFDNSNLIIMVRIMPPKGKIKKISKSNLVLKPSNIGPKSMLKMLTATEFHVDFDSGIKMGGCLAK